MIKRVHPRNQSGFTLIEITVVLFVIILFSALLAPNLINMRSAQQLRAAPGQVIDLLMEARVDAVNENTTYAVTWDSGTSEFDIKREPLQDQNSGTSSIAAPQARPLQTATSINSFEQVKSLALPKVIQAQAFRINGSESDSGSFALHFYADGSSDSGGFELAQGVNNVKSISVDKFGVPLLAEGNLPDPTDQLWTAGTYAQKI